jgi:hypothetical protein
MEKHTITYFIVEIGGADFYFEKLQDASDFFAKLVSSTGEKIGRLGYGDNAYYYKEGKHTPKMSQETMDVYQTKKAAEFAKHESGDKED